MLSSNHLSSSPKDNSDFSTILAIPIDILDNNSESVNSISIENLQISLTDGFFCLENENGSKVCLPYHLVFKLCNIRVICISLF